MQLGKPNGMLPKKPEKQQPLLIHLPKRYIKDMDFLVEIKHYPNRNEVIRTAVRDLLKIEVWSVNKVG